MADNDFVRSSCYAAAANAAKAAGAELSDRDLAAAFRAAQDEKARLKAAGVTDNVADRVKAIAEQTAERTRIAAALQKKHAALNILARDRLEQTIDAFKKAGLSPRDSILAVMEGSQQGIAGARDSVSARRLGYEARYVGGMMAEIQKDRPHLVNVLADKRLSDDVFREMGELREGGKPGVTGNEDAKYLADVFAKHVEASRTDLNRLGASIGKLDGWAGAQVHDDMKMMQAGKETWIDGIAPLLDLNRTFPDAASADEVKKILGDIYDTIVTGVPSTARASRATQRLYSFVNSPSSERFFDHPASDRAEWIDLENPSKPEIDKYDEGFGLIWSGADEKTAKAAAAKLKGDDKAAFQRGVKHAQRVDAGDAKLYRSFDEAISALPDDAVANLNELLDRIVPQRNKNRDALIHSSEIKIDEKQFSAHNVTDRIGAKVAGVTEISNLGVAIKIAVDLDNAADLIPQVARHESIHALKALGVFTKDEWDTLENAAKVNGWMGAFNKSNLEESIAEAFGAWGAGKNILEKFSKPDAEKVGGIFKKIIDFYTKLKDGLFSSEFDFEDIFKRIESGEIGSRPATKSRSTMAGSFYSLQTGGRVNPANLAKSLGKTRVLHFKDAESAIAYRDAFGYGNSIYGIMSHQRRAANMAAQMDMFGPNPEIMFNSLVEGERRKLRDNPNLSPEQKVKQIQKLNADAGPLRGAFDVMSGAISRPGNVNAAKIANDIRAVQSMAKLGGAVLTAMPTDVVGAAQAAMFRGSGFFNGMVKQIGGILKGRPKAEQAEISYLFGEGFDSLIGDVLSHGLANDGPVGKMSKLTETFFKWNGLNWWTDVGRSVVGRTVAAEMGMRADTAFKDLPANYSHVLGLHGIGERQWEALRQATRREAGGNAYITPDAIRDLPDAAVEPLVASRLASAKTPERKSEILEQGRRDLELQALRFVADETNYAIVETDAASRRVSTLGQRPGTMAGEAVRFAMQFKGFPIAFSQRVLGRALFGGRGASKYERVMNNAPHMGALIGGLTVAGYMAMTMKDLAKGYWPPRDPMDPKVMIAALTQGGALGIYGDFLFGQQNRFGQGAVETMFGPFVGTMSDIVNLPMKARTALEEGKTPQMAGDLLNLTLNNTPFINLAYVRPALDVLFINSLRNWASPGYVNRMQRGRFNTYGQRPLLPATL
jgi:hypothetical protein